MDALQRPLRIPPDFNSYAEDKGIFELYSRMLGELVVNKPSDPLQFLSDYLSRPKDIVPSIIVYGKPCSGQHTVSKLAARKMKAVHIQPQRVLEEDKSEAGKKARSFKKEGKEVPATLWAEILHSRLGQKDCVNKGFVLEGFPRTREQALALQAKGVIAKHFVHLEAPDSVLLERYSGKRVDSLTGDVYHLVFNPPKSEEIASRLIEEPGGVEENMLSNLTLYHRHSQSLLSCYGPVAKTFNVDQPINDIASQVYSFLCSVVRSAAPHTPRVVLVGPTGCGKSLQAAQLARKYHLVDVDMRKLIRQALVSGSKLADQMKPFHEKGMLIPDDMVMSILSKRLSQLDCASRGWVLHGFPLSRDQAELLTKSGHKPNRVVFLNISEDSVKERLTLRRIDPISGERYHLLYKPSSTQEIKERLQIHHRDSESEVTKRISLYNANVEDLSDYYTWCQQHVNADQDPGTVFECIESMLVNPLPIQTQKHAES